MPGIDIEVLCGIGAGDALTASFAAGLLRGLDPVTSVARGNAAGAIVASRLMCSTAMPTPGRDRRAARRAGAAGSKEAHPVTNPVDPPDLVIHPAKLPMRLDGASLHVHPDAERRGGDRSGALGLALPLVPGLRPR